MTIAVDVGTSSMRAGLWSAKGELLYLNRADCAPEYRGDGIVEQRPNSLEEKLFQLLKAQATFAAEKSLRVEAVALTCQRSSLVAVDASGSPIWPAIMWQDNRSRTVCDEVASKRRLIYERCGALPSTVFLAPKIRWLRSTEPTIYAKSFKLLSIADFLTARATGRFVTDLTYGSRTLLMDLHKGQWDEELLELFRVDPDKLCTIVPPGSVVAPLLDNVAAMVGLPKGTLWITAGGDQQCAAIGSGVLETGTVEVTSGTGSFVLAACDEMRLHPEGAVSCQASALPGKYVLEMSVLSTASIYEWFRNRMCDGVAFAELEELVGASPLGARGLLLLPHFQGRGSPDWDAAARGAVWGLTLNSTRADLARAILEGIAAEIANQLDVLSEVAGKAIKVIVGGGLSRSAAFNQIQADMFGVSVLSVAEEETTLKGAWVVASVALGRYSDHCHAYSAATKSGKVRKDPIDANVLAYRALRNRVNLLAESVGYFERHGELPSAHTC